MKILVIIIIVLTIQGCLSSGESDSSGSNGGDGRTQNTGGTPSEPSILIFDAKNSINNNIHYNYFKFSGFKGEKLFLQINLTIALSDRQRQRCREYPGSDEEPSRFNTQTHIYTPTLERVGGKCGDQMMFDVPDEGTYVFHFEFDSNGSGFFNATSVIGDAAITSPSGALGSPSSPEPMTLASNSNSLSAEDFFNYYRVTFDEGQKIVINTHLDQPLSPSQKQACRQYPGGGEEPSKFQTQVHVYDRNFERVDGVCGESLSFEPPEPGTYIFHFNYGMQSIGTFSAEKI